MNHYYVNNNAQPTGEHEVHKESCQYLPTNRTDLGYCSDCTEAVRKARQIYSNVDGCYYCSYPCHKRQTVKSIQFKNLGSAGDV